MGAVKLQPITAPAPLSTAHRLDTFQCIEAELEYWLKERALKNQLERASRTFVACANDEVVGYYALAAGADSTICKPGTLIPVIFTWV